MDIEEGGEGMIYFENGEVKASDYLLTIDCFKRAFELDKTKEKKHFYALLLYLFFMYDIHSPYFDYPEEVRYEYVMKDVLLGQPIEIKEEVRKECVRVFCQKKNVETFLLEKAIGAAHKLALYLDEIDFRQTDEAGNAKYNPKDLVVILKSIGDIVGSLKELRKQAKKAGEDEKYIEKELFEDE
ncbi:MAG: hypothetical protein RML94_00180 [Bacteroidia bacterium]|nr:hypothetical protein [Bacteroidia bacterium]